MNAVLLAAAQQWQQQRAYGMWWQANIDTKAAAYLPGW
jgi:hypothetical protein